MAAETQVLLNNEKKYIAKFFSDASESDVKKIDISTLTYIPLEEVLPILNTLVELTVPMSKSGTTCFITPSLLCLTDTYPLGGSMPFVALLI